MNQMVNSTLILETKNEYFYDYYPLITKESYYPLVTKEIGFNNRKVKLDSNIQT